MKTTRRPRSDSATAAITAAQNAALPDHEPPDSYPLKDAERPFFRDILRARSRDDWREVDLQLAAQLARCMNNIKIEEERLAGEDSVQMLDNGKMVENPRIGVIARYKSIQGSLMRTLQLGGRVALDPRDLQKAAELENKARRTRNDVVAEQEPLLAD